jgi:hypothetical protein
MACERDGVAHACQLHDISLGGVCLTLPTALPTEELLSKLIYLDLSLPVAASVPAGEAGVSLRLQLFGLVRGMRTTTTPATLHIRFLKRLPAELNACFAALA